jgi:glycosyltransferase involved in cell wall biosynthesis
MKILHILAPAQFGGLERVVVALAAGHRARNHRVAVAALLERGASEPAILSELRASDVSVQPVVLGRRAHWDQSKRLAALCAEFKPDVVHSHGYLPDILVAARRWRHGLRTVSTVHGFTGESLRMRLYEWLQIRAHRRFDAIVAVSTPIRDRLVAAGVAGDRVRTVRNAWAPGAARLVESGEARALLGTSGDFTLGWVGRVSHEKGLDVLVRALPALSDVSVQLTVIGDGPERPNVEALARDLRVDQRLRWMGTLPDAGRFMRGFDAFVLSSRTEGTPISLLEAMHACVPVVATAVGGVPDVVSPGEAVLVPPEQPEALAAAIRLTLADPSSAAQRAARARKRLADDFSAEPWLDAYESIYHEIHTSRI